MNICYIGIWLISPPNLALWEVQLVPLGLASVRISPEGGSAGKTSVNGKGGENGYKCVVRTVMVCTYESVLYSATLAIIFFFSEGGINDVESEASLGGICILHMNPIN